MTRHLVTSVLLFVASAVACSTSHDPVSTTTQVVAGDVTITVDQASYTWSEASTEGIRGTIRNNSDHAVYSNVGDAFNIAVEQDPLYIAAFSDGAIERQVGANAWAKVVVTPAIEGTRFIGLQPGHTYHFIANVTGTPQSGTHRVSLSFRSTINDEERATIATSYSATFEIR